ncbi:SDR family NAD(P)-dependent oxidoreductase [Paenarthrobacter sp. NPDC057981]|uniref:SDR family NAD(P)-dependent oxidoreductase n=1 Tax=Paenarthrobacter sp. NPDC057981 TaxID=3346297 RepID=UPI0036D92846
MNTFDHTGVGFIIGGGSGIGEATADTLASRGWRVAVGDRDLPAAQRVASRLAETGAQSIALPVDITDTGSVDDATAAAAKEWGQLDAVIPCAGIIAPSPSEDIEDDALFGMIDIHLLGTIRAVRAAFPYLKQSSNPSIIALSSVAAHMGLPHRLSYAAAKGGVEAVVKTLAVEWAAYGIRANAVAPGWVRTPMIKRAVAEGRLDITTLEHLSPLERLAEPIEIAEAIAFLASSGSGYVTGTTLMVDGALTIKGPWPQGVVPPTASQSD